MVMKRKESWTQVVKGQGDSTDLSMEPLDDEYVLLGTGPVAEVVKFPVGDRMTARVKVAVGSDDAPPDPSEAVHMCDVQIDRLAYAEFKVTIRGDGVEALCPNRCCYGTR